MPALPGTNLVLVHADFALLQEGDLEMSMARHIADRPAVAVRTGKQMFYEQIDKELKQAYAYASRIMAENMMAAETSEGIDAFIEKREPGWKKKK